MSDLREFKAGLNPYLEVDCCARPFVCTGSPLECRSFVVGLNVATRLRNPFSSYWSDDTGFDRKRFEDDHREERSRRGNRPRIEAIAKEIAPELVLVHSNEPVRFFEEKTGCRGFTSEVKRTCWQGHKFRLFGLRGALYTSGIEEATACGRKLARQLGW